MSEMNKQWLLASRPQGVPTEANFRLVETPVPEPVEGQVLVRHHFMSLDPYMRGRMDDAKSYAASQALDAVMQGGTVGEVVDSRHPGFKAGQMVVGAGGWQQYSLSDGRDLRVVDTGKVPASAWLGSVGMPGVTAWHGLNRIIEPKKGETVVVSAATGAVGSVVGQLAKRKGCRVVGIAGGAEKCRIVTEEYGFDACVDYKAGRLKEDLKAATPDGIDGNFENVGGEVFDAILARMNAFGRVAICGLISGYSGEAIPLRNVRSILVNRLLVRGFIVSDDMSSWPPALEELSGLVGSGQLSYRETIAEGIESAPAAFIGLLAGRNIGKQLVRLA
ncbi:MAG: NADP-dependent oxidoreductase [Pseudomonadota bacterium]|nr:NADP-dependent oxidoreductase [Pseudomonadota bacterium]